MIQHLTSYQAFGLDPIPGREIVIDERTTYLGKDFVIAVPNAPTVFNTLRAYIHEHALPHTRDARRAAQGAWNWVEVLDPMRDVRTIKRADGRLITAALQARGLSAGSVRRIMAVGIAALNHAKKEERITSVPRFQLPGTAQARQRVYTPEEQAKIMAFPKPRRIQLFLHIAFGTGARSEAIEELPWTNVDLVARTIDFRIRGTVYRNKKRAVVPINDTLLRRLVSAKEYRDAHAPDDPYVIGCGPRGRRTSTYHWIRRVAEAVGIDERGVCRHTIRHTVATRLLEAGVPIHKVAQLLGDRVSMIETNYAHVRPVALLECVNELR